MIVRPEDIAWNIPQAATSSASPQDAESQAIEQERLRALAMAPQGMPPLPPGMPAPWAMETNGPAPASKMPMMPNLPRYNPMHPHLPGQPEFAPFDVVLGEPKLIFSITNGPDDVFQGFLELVGPTNAIGSHNASNPGQMSPSAPEKDAN